MKSLSRLSLILLSCPLALASCGQMDTQSQLTDSVVPGSSAQIGRLGLGYDPLTKEFRSTACVTGDSLELGSKEARLEYLQDLGVDALSKKIGLTLGWSNGLLALSPEVEFLRSSASTSLANAYSILFEIKGKSTELAAESLRLTDSLANQQDSIAGPRLYDLCGQEYVSRVDYGAALLATIKVEFANHDDKKEFAAKAELQFPGAPGSGIFSGSFSKLSEGLKQRTRVIVSARQFGGNPTALLQILPSGIAKCTLEDLSPCVNLFENLARYSGTLGEQFKGPEDYVPVNYQTRNYSEQLNLSGLLPWASFESRIKEKLNRFSSELDKRATDRLRAKFVLNVFAPSLPAERQKQLQSIIDQLDKDVSALKERLNLCTRSVLDKESSIDSQNCESLSLSSYDVGAFESPISLLVFQNRFDTSNPLKGMTLNSSRPRIAQPSHNALHQILSVTLRNNGRWNCESSEWAALSIPVTVEDDGVFTISAETSLSACADCNARIAIGFDEVAFGFPRSGISKEIENPTKIEKSLRLVPGEHVLSVRIESDRICQGQSARLNIGNLRIERTVEPFTSGSSL